jgi:hypothetical protein
MKTALAVVLAVPLLFWAASASSIEKIYFGDTGHDKIRRCNLNGTVVEELVTTGLGAVGSIVVDRTGGKMYWTDWTGSTIKRANLDGSGVEILVSGLGGPYGIALDTGSGKMYWTEFSSARIRRANLDGTGIEDLVTTGLSHVNGIALDLAAGKMYWCDGSAINGEIDRANLDGTSIQNVVTGLIEPMEIALDVAGGKMYWADLGTDKVQRANMNGTGIEDLYTSSLGTPVGVALDLVAGKLYFTDFGGVVSKIQQCNLDGTGLVDVVSSGIGASYGLTLGPAVAECHDGNMDGPWIAVVSGVEPYDYPVYMMFDGAGVIPEMGSYNVPNPAGYYSVAPGCSVSGTLWSDGYQPFAGYISSDTTAEIDMGGLVLPMMKVLDPGALEGCWTGWFLQDTSVVQKNVTMTIDATGYVNPVSGLSPAATGRMFVESGYIAGHIKNGTEPDGWDEINFRETTLIGAAELRGTFGLDCGDCWGGTFALFRCATGAPGHTARRPAELYPNYPNPFNPQTTIAWSQAESGPVTLRVYDALGRLTRTLIDDIRRAGPHAVVWNGRTSAGRPAGSGVYFVRLETGGAVETRKIVLLK